VAGISSLSWALPVVVAWTTRDFADSIWLKSAARPSSACRRADLARQDGVPEALEQDAPLAG
jgi:hypothetical protein